MLRRGSRAVRTSHYGVDDVPEEHDEKALVIDSSVPLGFGISGYSPYETSFSSLVFEESDEEACGLTELDAPAAINKDANLGSSSSLR
jgi:hypothetical protein